MPKFYRQNKKRIDPRYFLNETTNRDEDIKESASNHFSYQDDLTWQYNQNQRRKMKDNVESMLQHMLSSGAASGMEVEFAKILDDSMDEKLSQEHVDQLVAAYGQFKTGPEVQAALKDAVESIYSGMSKDSAADTDLSKIDRDRDGKISADQLSNIANAIKKNQA